MAIRFFDVHEAPYGALSHFSKHPFTLDKVWYPTAEHAIQCAKFIGTPQAEEIRRLRGAKDVARVARVCQSLVRPDWDEVKDITVRRVLLAKFSAHPELRALLLGTGAEPIEFAAPLDDYWGIGKDGTGSNRLGQLLEELRRTLQTFRATFAPLPPGPSEPPSDQPG